MGAAPAQHFGTFPTGTTIFVDIDNTDGVEDGSASNPFNTTTPTGKILLGVLASVAEFEKALIVGRTTKGDGRAGAKTAELGSRLGGQNKKRWQRSRCFSSILGLSRLALQFSLT